jgi:hypothetical protein
MLDDNEPFSSIAGETVMVQPEPKPPVAEIETLRPGALDPNGVGHSRARNDPGDDTEDRAALRGVVALDIPREVIARFSGTLILNELPERQPEIVFDTGRRFRDDDDE